MGRRLQRDLGRLSLGLSVLLAASAASAQPCCECRCPRNDVPACSEDFGLDEAAYLAAVCEPLGCSSAVCTDKACAQANRCPRTEDEHCGDGFDNDADSIVDCDDPDCEGADPCVGGPSPTPGGDADCCVEHDFGGCDVAPCQSCVCNLDAFCCDVAWDTACIDLASSDCDVCECESPPTPLPTAGGSPTRAPTSEVTPTPPTPVPSPGPPSNCCTGREPEDGPGCSLAVCETCVCNVDDFCCTEFWDGTCADIAGAGCLADCACDSAPPLPSNTPTSATPTRTRTTAPGTRPPRATATPAPACTSTVDCPAGLVCGPSGRCVAPRPTRSGSGGGGGCAVQPSTAGHTHLAWLVLPLLLRVIAGDRGRQ